MLEPVQSQQSWAHLYDIVITITIDQKVLRFEISMYDTPGMAEVDSIDQLEHQ